MTAYIVIALVWIAQHGVELLTNRAVRKAAARGDRRAAMGWVGATTLGRVWTIAPRRPPGRRPRQQGTPGWAAGRASRRSCSRSTSVAGCSPKLPRTGGDPTGSDGLLVHQAEGPLRARRLLRDHHRAAADLRQRRQRTTSSSPRTSSSSTTGSRSTSRESISRSPAPVLYLLLASAPDDHGDGLHRPSYGDEAEPRADRGRGSPTTVHQEQHHRRQYLSGSYAIRWFPFIATLFFFIAFSNIIGYLPLPTNSAETVNVFGLAIPVVRDLRGDGEYLLRARSHPCRLVQLPHRGDQGQGASSSTWAASCRPALEDMKPGGQGPDLRGSSCSPTSCGSSRSPVRLFANILAGHLLLLFMGGGLAVLARPVRARGADLPARVRLLHLGGGG